MARVLRNRARELVAIKQRKEQRTITQRDIAEETGIALSTVSRWYRNDVARMDSDIVIALMDYFNCELTDLIVIEELDDEGQRQTPLAATA